MTLYQKLERKLGRYAIPNLMLYICVMYLIGYLIQVMNPTFYYYYLDLDPEAIVHGQIWRIVTFLFYYPSDNIFWFAIGAFLYYSLGRTLEMAWGTFKYNFFFFLGALMLVVAGLLLYFITGYPFQLYPTYMTFSIFLAYALTFPDAVFLLYFIIPVKAVWLAVFEMILYVYELIATPYPETKIAILLSLLNVAVFFWMTKDRRNSNIFRMRDFR